MHMEFIQYLHAHGIQNNATMISGSGMDFMIGRISFTFSLIGPSIAVHTACSSSLVALHNAKLDMTSGAENTAAISSGTFCILFSGTMSGISQLSAFSADGRCKTFDLAADGYGRGEGVVSYGLQVRKPDSEKICVLKGTCVNHSGRSSGLTAPHGPSQKSLILNCMRSSSIGSSASLELISSHGTGTSLGDPIEVSGIIQAILHAKGNDKNTFVQLIASKSHQAHTEGAAGLTGALHALHCIDSQVIGASEKSMLEIQW